MPHILIIDDDQTQLDLFSAAFKIKGIEVQTADTGERGLTIARTWHPDLILLDIVMPNENGIDVLKKIRQEPVLAKQKVLMMTNLTQPGLEKEIAQAGGAELVLKTNLVPSELVERALKIINPGPVA